MSVDDVEFIDALRRECRADDAPTIVIGDRPVVERDFVPVAAAVLTTAQKRKAEGEERRRLAWRQFLRNPSRKR